ncbi:unnamed protein product [Urochloa humidicola]
MINGPICLLGFEDWLRHREALGPPPPLRRRPRARSCRSSCETPESPRSSLPAHFILARAPPLSPHQHRSSGRGVGICVTASPQPQLRQICVFNNE